MSAHSLEMGKLEGHAVPTSVYDRSAALLLQEPTLYRPTQPDAPPPRIPKPRKHFSILTEPFDTDAPHSFSLRSAPVSLEDNKSKVLRTARLYARSERKRNEADPGLTQYGHEVHEDAELGDEDYILIDEVDSQKKTEFHNVTFRAKGCP